MAQAAYSTGREITGHDGHIFCTALAYAIIAIERLPEKWQERSDKEDMKKLLEAATSTPDYYLLQARSHLEQRVLTIDEDGELGDADPGSGVVIQFPSDEDHSDGERP
jgi:hypothetical protein